MSRLKMRAVTVQADGIGEVTLSIEPQDQGVLVVAHGDPEAHSPRSYVGLCRSVEQAPSCAAGAWYAAAELDNPGEQAQEQRELADLILMVLT